MALRLGKDEGGRMKDEPKKGTRSVRVWLRLRYSVETPELYLGEPVGRVAELVEVNDALAEKDE
jgi:hypothetical protein